MLKFLGGALGAAALFLAPAPAQADEICREVTDDGRRLAEVCVTLELGLDGTTVAPRFDVDCALSDELGNDPCHQVVFNGDTMGKTGFVPSMTPPPVTIDPETLTVIVGPGEIGTLWLDGTPRPLSISRYCVGDPNIC